MKKYFLSLVAIAAAMLFATSCQESLVEPQVDGTTTFTIEVPGQMGTKATTDVINRLYVEVYSADGSTLVHRPNFYTMADGKATVTLNLVANQEYDIIFWAQNGEAYNTESLKSIKMNALHHNSENGAAFYAVLDNYNPINGKQEVKLTRPFAQLNLWTTNEVDYGSGEVTIVKSTIKVENAASEFNRVNDQNFGKGIASTTYTYVSDVLPQGTKTINNGTEDIVYQYVSMDYLAVPDNQALVNITATIVVEDPNGVRSEIVREIRDVPVQLNFKTNIIGNLITSANEFEVSLNENWLGETTKEVEFREVATAEELQEAIQDGVDNITLTEDITLDQPLVFGAPSQSHIARASVNETSFVLDLNGKNLKGSISVHNGIDLIVNNGNIESENPAYSGIESKGSLTLNNVNIISARHALRIESGKAVIDGGEYKVKPVSSMTVHALNVGDDNTSAEVLIKNGQFIGPRGTIGDSGSAVKVRNGSKVTIENGVFSKGKTETLDANQEVLVVKGGEFDQDPTDWVAVGYRAVATADGKTYVVLPATENYDIVITDPAQLINGEVLRDYDNILLQLSAGKYTIDLYMAASFDANLTIIGTKGTKVEFAEQQVMMALVKNFTIKNCEILHMATKSWGMLVFGSGNKEDGEYTIENCTFNGVGTQGIYINEEKSRATYNIIDCTFNGDFGSEGAITIQPNKDVKHIVNVKRCEFNNIPATSHRIFLAPYDGKKALFYGFTLDTDLKATTAYELEMFLKLGQAQLGCDLTFSASETSANSGYGATGVEVAGKAVLDGQGHTLTVNNAWGTWDCVVAAKGGRIENLTVSGAMRGIFMPGAEGNVYIDNVIFDNVIYTFNSDAGSKEYGVYISNSTLNGWTSHSDVHKEVVYTNCKFGEGNGYAFCRPYGPTSFVGCDFEADFEVDAIGKITFENCTIGGEALTADNLETLVIDGIANATVK